MMHSNLNQLTLRTIIEKLREKLGVDTIMEEDGKVKEGFRYGIQKVRQ